MRHFEIVPRSTSKVWRNGPRGGPANVRLDQLARITFSKRAAEIFEPFNMLIAGYDRDARELCFTAVSEPPQGYTDAACYPINWIKTRKHKLKSHCSMAGKLLFQKIGFTGLRLDLEIVSMDAESHSIVVSLPEQAPERFIDQTGIAERGHQPTCDAVRLADGSKCNCAGLSEWKRSKSDQTSAVIRPNGEDHTAA